MSNRKPKPATGIESRQSKDGAWSHRGKVWSARDKKRIIGPWFPTIAAARNWRQDALVGLRQGTVRAPVALTLREAADLSLIHI